MQRRPCWVEIRTKALEDNYRLLAAAAPIELLAIVKADAYGHGLKLCAPAAVRAGARWLGVTSVEEGVAARALCPDAEILAISGPFAGQGPESIANRLTCVAWQYWQLDELEAAAQHAQKTAAVHVELDTGMSRQGVGASDLDAILARFHAASPLRLNGLMTHLYAADESDGGATQAQFAELEKLVERVFTAGHKPVWLHVGNSAAVLAGEIPNALQTLCAKWNLKAMARPGLALYGLAPAFSPTEPESVRLLRGQLQSVLAWKTRIVSTRSIPDGQAVGYNGTFIATEPMRIALLAVGYADGLKRALSNHGYVLIHGQRAPIIGRISMDQTVVDVTDIPGAQAGDEVLLLGTSSGATVSAEEHAGWSKTIPWEIFTSIATRVERIRI